MNLRNRLLVFLVPGVIFSLLVLTVVNVLVVQKSLIAQQDVAFRVVVNKSLHELDTWIHNQHNKIGILSKMALLRSAFRENRVGAVLQKLREIHSVFPKYEVLFLSRLNGLIFADSIGGKTAGVNIAKNPLYRANLSMVKRGRSYISRAGKSPFSTKPILLITVPIKENGKVTGFVGGAIDLVAFSKDFVGKVKLGFGASIALDDETGMTLAHPNSKFILNLNVTKFSFGKKFMSVRNKKVEYSFKGQDKFGYVGHYAPKDWRVIVIVTKAEMLGPISRIMVIAVLVGMSALVVIVLIIWFATSSVYSTINKVVDALNASSKQTSEASDQVAQSSQLLAQAANSTSSSLEESSAALQQMSSIVKQNADNAREANKLSHEVQNAGQKGGKIMQDMLQIMDQVNDSSREIETIMKNIDDVAFQTNLLALNAAIEAARAGESGAGFAVVAEEVRQLARRSAESAQETAVKIDTAKVGADKGAQVSQHVASSLNEIIDGVQQINILVNEVSAGAEEQARGIDQVNIAVSQMNSGAQSTAANAEQAAAASEELHAQSRELTQTVTELAALIGAKVDM